MINVTLYYRPKDPQCQAAIEILQSLNERFPHNLILVDIDTDLDLNQRFSGQIPVVRVGPYLLRQNFTKSDLEVALGAARDRATRLAETEDPKFQKRMERGRVFSAADRLANWFSHHYLAVFNIFLFVYVGLPFAAPVLMKENLQDPAKIIYTIYSPLCHQLAFRSFFFFGEQAYYPRSLAGVPGAITYEAMMGLNPAANEQNDTFIYDARTFLGNDTVGYKVAICERDVAMYASLLLFGLIFAASGKRIKSVKWYLWLIIGLVPIAVDGGSQLPGLIAGLPQIINRESTPFLRVLTGTLFGLMTAWYLFPLIEASMKETRSMFAYKKVAVDQIPHNDQS